MFLRSNKIATATLLSTISIIALSAASLSISENDMKEEKTKSTKKWHIYRGRPDPESLKGVKIFSGSGHPELTQNISSFLGIEVSKAKVGAFNDGEVSINIEENVRSSDVYIVQPTCSPVDKNLIELLLFISAMKRASARKITAVIPYYGYARQDSKPIGRTPISASDVARMLETMGVDRIICVELHAGQIQGFFGPKIPVDNVGAIPIAAALFSEKDLKDPVVVSPDAAGVYRAKDFRSSMLKFGYDSGLAMVIRQKDRLSSVSEVEEKGMRAGEGSFFPENLNGKVGTDHIVGNVKGCDVIIVDDIIDTGGTLCNAAAALKRAGALKIYAFSTHGVFSGEAIDRINKSDIDEVVITDTIPFSKEALGPKIKVMTLAPLIAEVIHRVHTKSSVSQMWKGASEK